MSFSTFAMRKKIILKSNRFVPTQSPEVTGIAPQALINDANSLIVQ